MEPLTLPQVDPGAWLGGPADQPTRFSVMRRKDHWEVWDLYCKEAGRFMKFNLKDRAKALTLISRWAGRRVILSDVVDPPIQFPPPEGKKPKAPVTFGVDE